MCATPPAGVVTIPVLQIPRLPAGMIVIITQSHCEDGSTNRKSSE